MLTSKVLIIKTGFSETFDPRVSETVSLGDVFITTMVLHAFKDCHVTWLTSPLAIPLLENNPYIGTLLPYNLTSILQLKNEVFDTVINLEKVPGLCALADSVDATFIRYGFAFDRLSGKATVRPASRALDPYMDMMIKKEDRCFWPEVLFEAVGRKWDGEECVLGRESESEAKHDVGFNNKVGLKWPNKAWPNANFILLERGLKGLGHSVCWQKGEKDVREYIDWIGSCKLIVTNDSLGLHLAVALKRKVVGLFGPTSVHPRYLDKSGTMLLSDCCDRSPCWESECPCTAIPYCMEGISVGRVLEEVKGLLLC